MEQLESIRKMLSRIYIGTLFNQFPFKQIQ